MKINILFRFTLVIVFTFSGYLSNAQEKGNKINIVDFKVVKNNNKISINWTTDNALSTNYFEVEKSNDGKNFKTLVYILGADPAKDDCNCYGCFDRIINNKESYYRVKHVSSDGEVEFSETKIFESNNN